MIPKKIHYCWYGNGEFNDILKKCMASWKEKLPEYELKKWDESNTPFDKLPFLRLLYKQKKWSLITDYMRLYAIYIEGGIYLDTDIEVFKTFDDLLSNESFIGFQISTFNTKIPVNSAVIGAVKHNSFVLDSIKETEKNHRLHFHSKAGPNVVSKVLIRYGLKKYGLQEINNVKILPVEYFHPLHWSLDFKEAPKYITKDSYCIHWWQVSWGYKKKNLNYFAKSLKRRIQKLPLILKSRLLFLLNEKSFYHIDTF